MSANNQCRDVNEAVGRQEGGRDIELETIT